MSVLVDPRIAGIDPARTFSGRTELVPYDGWRERVYLILRDSAARIRTPWWEPWKNPAADAALWEKP